MDHFSWTPLVVLLPGLQGAEDACEEGMKRGRVIGVAIEQEKHCTSAAGERPFTEMACCMR